MWHIFQLKGVYGSVHQTRLFDLYQKNMILDSSEPDESSKNIFKKSLDKSTKSIARCCFLSN